MKKTIIALLALAGVAAGAEPITLTLTSPDSDLGTDGKGNQALAWSDEGYDTLTSWSLSFTLNDKSLTDNTNLFSTRQFDSGAEGYVLRSNSNGSITLVYRDHPDTLDTVLTSDSGIVTAGTDTAITLKFVSNVNKLDNKVIGGTFTIIGGGKTCSVELDKDDYLEHTSLQNDVNCRFWTNRSGNPASPAETFSNISLQKIDDNIVVVPEPTTATLSLLALAGLAARRRRASR